MDDAGGTILSPNSRRIFGGSIAGHMDGTASRPDAVRHLPGPTRGAFVIERDGRRIAEMTYVRAGATRAIVDHTAVDDAARAAMAPGCDSCRRSSRGHAPKG